MNYIEQDTLTKDLRKLKGIMVSLSALENEISIGSINKELDKAVGFFSDQLFEVVNDIDEMLKNTSKNDK